MKKNDFILIQASMVEDLGLSGNRLIIYALIHGYCKDGIHEFTGSINYICEWTNLTRNTVISTLKSLVADGLIVKREYTANSVKFCAYSLGGGAKIAPVVQNFDEGGANFELSGSAKIAPNNTNSNNKDKHKDNISIVASQETEDEFAERIYALYPTKCPQRNTTLGKSYKDKERIKKLLKIYSKEDIEKVVKKEIEEKYGKCYMSNFSTFLNNFPDPQSLFEEGISQECQETNNPYPQGYWQ